MDIAEQVIRAKQDLDDVYTAGQSSMVDESKLIPKTVSGSYISVDNVSEIPHSVKCKVESVNLIGLNDVDTTNVGVTIKTIGGSLFLDGTISDKVEIGAHSSKLWFKPVLLPAGTYTYNVQVIGAGEISEAMLRTNDEAFSRLYSQRVASGETKSTSFTLTEPTSVVGATWLYNTTYDNTEARFWLNKGTTALPYTPYVKPEEVSVTRTGKNLCPEEVESGYYWDSNGAPTGANASYVRVKPFAVSPSTKYTISSNLTLYTIWYFGKGTVISRESRSGLTKWTITTPENCDEIRVSLHNTSGAADTVAFEYAQLEFGSTATEYEPNIKAQTLTPATDGTVEGMTSVSPYMNIFSDTEGVNIEVEYNKSYGMQTEYDRFWDAMQNNGNRTDYNSAFSSRGWNKDTFKPKYDIALISSNRMFYQFNYDNRYPVVDLVELLEKAGVTMTFADEVVTCYQCFHSARISRVGVIDVTGLTNQTQMSGIFSTKHLVTIDKFILCEENTPVSTFTDATGLKNITIEGVIGNSINFQWCPLTKASITNIIEHLSSTATGQTLTLKLSAVNTAFETSAGANDGSTSAEFAALVATKTNWTITMI